MIDTLGPFARLLYFALSKSSDKTNPNKLFKDHYFTVYRGLGLPQKALKEYNAFYESGEWFKFSAFTSTSLVKTAALEFSFNAK